MQPAQPNRAKEIFSEAAELDPASRELYLQASCGGDAELLGEVRRLLMALESGSTIGDCVGEFLISPSGEPGALSNGDRIGRFRITRQIGAGGMGRVHEAEDMEFGGRVALKTLHPEYADRSDFAARFRREIQLARKVTHPNVCRILDVGRHELHGRQITFLTMEFLAGETVAERLKRGRVPPAEALPILRQIAQGLAALHAAGVIHRDLKPANIIVAPSGQRAVITDFGLAHTIEPAELEEQLTTAGQILGTPAYMPPEQLAGKKLVPQADIYSLGVVMYEMLTGRRPFESSNFVESAALKMARTPDPPSRFVQLDSRWDSLILQCLEADVDKRPRNVAQVLGLLNGLDTGESVAVHRWRRKLLMFGGIAAGTVAIALPAAYIYAEPDWRRTLCGKGLEFACRLPADKDIAVLPFETLGASESERKLAAGTARYVRTGFERLAHTPEIACVHVRNDRLTDGARLVLEGNVRVGEDSILLRLTIREPQSPGGAEPLVLRRIRVIVPRRDAARIHAEAQRAIASALEIHYDDRLWRGWTRTAPRSNETMLAHLEGLGSLEAGQLDEAARLFNAAIDPNRDFSFAPAHTGLGDAYRLMRNKTGAVEWELRARQAYQRAVPLDRDFGFAGASQRWGELDLESGNPSSAVERLNLALPLWSHDVSLRRSLASAWEAAGQAARAETVLVEGTQRYPHCWLAHNTLADFYSRHARLDEAEKVLMEVVRLAPDNAHAYHNLAFNYIRVGRFADAVEMAAQSIRLRTIPLAYSTLGRALLQLGCRDHALVNLRKATELQSDFYVLWANLSDALAGAEASAEEAKAAADRTLQLAARRLEQSGADAYARAQEAVNLARTGQFDRAIASADRAVSLAPNSRDILLLQAEALEVAGQRSRALEALERLLSGGLPPWQVALHPALKQLSAGEGYTRLIRKLRLPRGTGAGGLTPPADRNCPESLTPGASITK
jgi:tetratricopeptide (TPR) repeat protein